MGFEIDWALEIHFPSSASLAWGFREIRYIGEYTFRINGEIGFWNY